jgi:dTDP-4-dehydrorhamnose reductase
VPKEKNIKILVIGSDGQLGWELQRQGQFFNFEIIGVDLPQIDITNMIQVEKALSAYQPVLIVNAAAYTNVDRAESEPDLAFAVNRDGPDNLARACANANLPFIHISTDYVFDGQKKSPYIEGLAKKERLSRLLPTNTDVPPAPAILLKLF